MPVDTNSIQRQLLQVKHPELKKDIISLGMVSKIDQTEEGILLVLKTPNQDRRLQLGLEAQIRTLLSKLDGAPKAKIKFEVDPKMKLDDGNRIPGVKNVVAVGSGKGGVGKSTVTANLAITAAKAGFKVGVMDADIYGPSLGKMFGVNGRVALKTEDDKIFPVDKFGTKLISFSFLVNDNQPVVWRGPMLGKAVEQFLYDMVWGELDYLFIDLPPGTGDVQLSLAQLIDLDGAILVTTPQSVAVLDASRAAAMFSSVKVPLLGVVENMSEFLCPHCGGSSKIFGEGGGSALAEKYGAPLLGGIPLTLGLMKSGEEGIPFCEKEQTSEVAKAYKAIFENVNKEIEKWKD